MLRAKLHQELIDAGIDDNKMLVRSLEGDSEIGAIIKFADGVDMQLVQQIIDAHDPAPIPSTPTEIERIAQLEQENALLKAQKKALSEQVDFHEELIVELATQIYA